MYNFSYGYYKVQAGEEKIYVYLKVVGIYLQLKFCSKLPITM